jgi:GNAT superfamily N-acetyltransferase
MTEFHAGAITFRIGAAADAAKIAALHTASWRGAYRGILPDAYLDGEIVPERLALWKKRLRSSGRDRRLVLLAEDRAELAGFVCVLLDEEPEWGASLDNLHVRQDLKGRGLGRRLFAAAARWVMSKQPGWPLHLWVFEANRTARGFYERFKGEVVAREIKRMPGMAEVPSLRYVWRDVGTLLNLLDRPGSA